MTDTSIETAIPIGPCHTDDPYDAEYGGWDAADLVALVEAVIEFHAAVWPEGEVDGDGNPADIIIEHAKRATAQVVKLRELAVEVSDPYRAVWVGERGRELLAELADYVVIEEPEASSRDL